MFTTNRYLELIGMRTCLAYLACLAPAWGRAIVGDVLLRRHRLEGPRRVDRLIRRNVDPLLSSRPPGLARSAQGADPRARSAHRRSPPPSMGPTRLALSARRIAGGYGERPQHRRYGVRAGACDTAPRRPGPNAPSGRNRVLQWLRRHECERQLRQDQALRRH